MSVLETVGMILGAMPLLITAVQHYNEELKPIEDHLFPSGSSLEQFYTRLRLQRRIFRDSLRRLMILAEIPKEEVIKLFDLIGDTSHSTNPWNNKGFEKRLRRGLGQSEFELLKDRTRQMDRTLELMGNLVGLERKSKWVYQDPQEIKHRRMGLMLTDVLSRIDYEWRRIRLPFSGKKCDELMKYIELYNQEILEIVSRKSLTSSLLQPESVKGKPLVFPLPSTSPKHQSPIIPPSPDEKRLSNPDLIQVPISFHTTHLKGRRADRKVHSNNRTHSTTKSGYESLGQISSSGTGRNAADEPNDNVICSIIDHQDLQWTEDANKTFLCIFSNNLHQSLDGYLDWKAFVALRKNVISRILCEFSIRARYLAKSAQQEKAALLVREQSSLISKAVQERAQGLDSYMYEIPSIMPEDGELSTVAEKVLDWNTTADVEKGQSQFNEKENKFEIGENDYTIKIFSEVREFLVRSNAYKWLIGRFRSELLLTERFYEIISKIRVRIARRLRSQHSNFSQEPFNASFDVKWDPKAFLSEQFPGALRQSWDSFPRLGDIIVLNGSEIDAEALTCSQYVSQVWPVSGPELLHILERAIHNPKGHINHGHMDDGSKLEICISNKALHVSIVASESSVIEVGEQLAWICAALRASPKGQMVCATPQITTPSGTNYKFVIDCFFRDLNPPTLELQSTDGVCWHALFQNPVIVKGYPILKRYNNERGLEISLEMMAFLGEAHRATVFDNNLVLKGFSTMFVPTKRNEGDSIQWHFLFNKDKSRISYLDTKMRCSSLVSADALNTLTLESSRNFLGWASSVELRTGTKYMRYNEIGWPNESGCKFAVSGIAVDKASFSVGKLVTFNIGLARGIKDTPAYLSRTGSYSQKIRALKSMYVVLYDVKDRRGWLVDGTHALLHLVCTRISEEDQVSELKNFEFAKIEDGHDSATKALSDPSNRRLVISDDELSDDDITTPFEQKHNVWRVQDLVSDFFHSLEWLSDNEHKKLTSSVIPIRGTFRNKLEGFAFKDIVASTTMAQPRELTLKPSGKGWVAFTKSIRAVTLLGTGFGELICPKINNDSICDHWRHAPKGFDYLAAPIITLREIHEKYGNDTGQHLSISDGVFWHQGHSMFEKCKCKPQDNQTPCNRIQELYSPAIWLKSPCNPFICSEGAVLFGRYSKLKPLRASKNCDFQDNILETGCGNGSSSGDQSFLRDSGLGSSVPSSAAADGYNSSLEISTRESGRSSAYPTNNNQERGNLVPQDHPQESQTVPFVTESFSMDHTSLGPNQAFAASPAVSILDERVSALSTRKRLNGMPRSIRS